MPFKSSSQMKAAFAGGLGPEMQAKADTWAHETPSISSLPVHVGTPAPSPLLKGVTPDAIGSNVTTLKNRGMNEHEATKTAIKKSQPYNNSHKRLGKFLHPRKDGKAHGSTYGE